MRPLLLQHIAAVAAPIPAKQRLLEGPLLSETLEGRVIERKARNEWPSSIAFAEGISIDQVRSILADAKNAEREDRRRAEGKVQAVKHGRSTAAPAAPEAPKKKKIWRSPSKIAALTGRTFSDLPEAERAAAKAEAIRRTDAGESVADVAADLNVRKQAIYQARYDAKKPKAK